MEKRHTTPQIRHQRYRHIKYKRNILKNVKHDDRAMTCSGRLSKNKIHCSCPLCAGKTNSKKLNGKKHNWKFSDLKKIENMDSQMIEME